MLREVEKADFGIQIGGGKKVRGMLFADNFVGVSGSNECLQKPMSVVHGYCNKWRLKLIRESVDSLCRDDADMPMPPYIRKAYNRPNAAFVSLFR